MALDLCTSICIDCVQKPRHILAEWDADACVWVATSDDVPGLATESDTLEALADKLKRLVPELMQANGESVDVEIRLSMIRKLHAEGCRIERPGNGDHDIWCSPHTDVRFPVDHKIKSRHTANAVLRQAGLPQSI